MRKISTILLLMLFSVGLFACGTKQELIVDFDTRRLDEAWEVAYERGVSMGYSPERLDFETHIADLYRADIDQAVPTKLHIRLEIITQEKIDNGKVKEPEKFEGLILPLLYMTGKDEEIARDDKQVLFDMNKIAVHVQRCCGLKMEQDK